jgi:hypothetical protein
MTTLNNIFGLSALVFIPTQIILLRRGNIRRWIVDRMGTSLSGSLEEENILIKHVIFLDSILCFMISLVHFIILSQYGKKVPLIISVSYMTQGIIMEIIMALISTIMIRRLGIPPRNPSFDISVRNEMILNLRRILQQIYTVEEFIPRVKEEECQKEECAVCYEESVVDLMPHYECHCSKKLICENCLFTHLQYNSRKCPWCRHTITQIYTRKWEEPLNPPEVVIYQ